MSFRSIALAFSYCFITVFTACSSATSIAPASSIDQYKQRVKASLSQLSQTNKDKQWAYTRTTVQGKEKEQQITIESFDPSQPQQQQWTLIKDSGKTPTDKQQKKYRKDQTDKAKQAKIQADEENKDQEKALVDMIRFDSLTIIKEQDNQTTLSFAPQLEKMGEDSQKHLAGTIIFDRSTNQVSQLLIENTADLNPALSVTLKQFKMAFTLTYKQQSLLPKQINIDIYGKAAIFTTIDQSTQESYSNYRHVGTSLSSNKPETKEKP